MKDNSKRMEWACEHASSLLIAKYQDRDLIYKYDREGNSSYKTEEIQDEFNSLYDQAYDLYPIRMLEIAKRYLKEAEVAYDIWILGEVKTQLENTDYEWDEDKGQEVLDNMMKRYDANEGFNWEILDYHIDQVFDKEESDYKLNNR